MRAKKGRIVLVTLFAVLCLSTLVLAVDCPLPDTGQTKCYDDEQEITCPQPGEDFYGQDAQYSCNPQSYTKLDANGNDLPVEANEWVMVRDNVTGLIWEVKTNDGGIHDTHNGYWWDDAQDGFIATLNAQNFGGFSDWRLPTVKELSFIRNMDTYQPAINTDFFPNTQAFYYWSSTTNAGNPFYAWIVDFFDGFVIPGYKSFYITWQSTLCVLAVRGVQCGSLGNYIHNKDGTVTDTETGLMWQKDTAPGTYTWKQALAYADTSTLAGYEDWRLPNVNELESLVEYSQYDPSIDTTYFPNTQSSTYWSSTTGAPGPFYAWIVDFFDGHMEPDFKSSNSLYVRVVRGGQCESFVPSTTTTVASTSTSTMEPTTTTTTVTPSTTTTTTVSTLCPIEQIYGEQSEEVDLLRRFRDSILSQTPEGQELIKLYYGLSPVIVAMMNEDEQFKAQVKEMIDGVVEVIRVM